MPIQFPIILAILIQLLPPPCFGCRIVECGAGDGAVEVVVEVDEGCCGGCCVEEEEGTPFERDDDGCEKCVEGCEWDRDGRQPLIPSGDVVEGLTLASIAGAPSVLVGMSGGDNRLVSWGYGTGDREVVSASARRAVLCCWTT